MIRNVHAKYQQQILEQDYRQNSKEFDMQDLQAEAPAEMPAEETVDTAVSETSAEEPQVQASEVGPQVPSSTERQERPRLAGLVVDIPQKVRPVLSNVTMRLTAEDKSAAQALAHERGMSLSEFCAALVAGAVRKARVAEKPAA